MPSSTAVSSRRSSWALRLAFGFMLLAIGSAAVLVLALVGATAASVATAPTSRVPVVAEAPGAEEPTPESVAPVWDRHGPINVLLIGVDAGLGGACQSTNYQLSDTILLARYDPGSGRAGLMSVPRDLFVYVEGYGGRKINTAHALGEGRAEEGPGLLRRTIESNLQIPVHRYARVDLDGFEALVDSIGGIEVTVPPSPGDPSVGLYDPNYPDGQCGTQVVAFDPGVQQMDGAEALQYARSRKTTSDFDRSRRQMDVLMAIREKAMRPTVLPRLPKLLPALLDTVDTDMTLAEILALSRMARDVGPDSIDRYIIGPGVVYDDRVTVDQVAQSVLRLQPAEYRALRQRFLELTPDVQVEAGEGEPSG